MRDLVARGLENPRLLRALPMIPWLVMGVVGLVLSVTYNLGSLSQPRPGLWPALLSAALIIVATLGALLDRYEAELETAASRRSLLLITGTFALYAWAFSLIGLTIPSFLLCMYWLRTFGHMRWRNAASSSAIGVFVVYLVFVVMLNLRLPNDPLVELLTGVASG